MSIAISVMVRPSRLLRLSVAAMGLLLLVSASLLLMSSSSDERLVLRHLFSVVCAAAAVPLFFHARSLARQTNVCAIDISGTGEIRLHHTGRVAAAPGSGEVVQLLKDSTLCSSMLLLRLRSANGQLFVVPVLPDSLDASSFRCLSIACRWIVNQDLAPRT